MARRIAALIAAAVILGLGGAAASEVTGIAASQRKAMLSGAAPERSHASAGANVFQDLRCDTCHRPGAQGLGPPLEGLFGKTVRLQSGETMTVDEDYVRESIVNPSAKVVAGFQPIMPTFECVVTEERLLELIEYIKSLKAPPQVPTR